MKVWVVKAAAAVLLLTCARSAIEVAEGVRIKSPVRKAKCRLDLRVVAIFARRPY